MNVKRYLWLGLVVESNLPLTAAEAPVASVPALRVFLCSTPAPVRDSRAELLALREGEAPYRAWRGSRGFVLEIGELGTLVVDPSLARMTVHRGEANEELLTILVSGLGFAFWLGLRGEVVLHGSATAGADGRAVVLIGPSGAGKSTLATLLCASDRELLADDSVRLSRAGAGWVAHGGATEVRLRAGASSATELFEMVSARQTIDGRLALKLPGASLGGSQVMHIAVPRIAPAITPRATRLPAAAGLVELLHCLRFGAWLPGGTLVTQTRTLAQLAREVSMYEVVVPRCDEFVEKRAHLAELWLVQLGANNDEGSSQLHRNP